MAMAEEEPELMMKNSSFQPFPKDLFNWKLVTDDFLEASKELELGELLHDNMFGLFEAMSAIEMMDPKMDAGMAKGSIKRRKPLGFNEALEQKILPWDKVTASEFVTIFDHTMACMITWFEGHSLAQTVFTNLVSEKLVNLTCQKYLHCGDDPTQRPTNPELRSFVVATLKFVDLVRDIIAKASVFEEEDFQPLHYGFQLASDISEVKAMSLLKESEESMQKLVRSTKNNIESQEHKEALSVCSRLKFYRHFFFALSFLAKQDINDAMRHVNTAKDQLPTIEATLKFGIVPAPGDNILGFEPMVNQRLLPPTFPRYTEIRTKEATYDYLSKLLQRLIEATQVSHLTTYLSALEFYMEFGRSSPCVLSRSISQLLYTPLYPSPQNQAARLSGPLPAFQDLLKEACKSFIAPLALTMKTAPFNTQQVKDGVETFFSQWCRPMGLLLQTFGHNCARQRDKIPTLLEEFAIAQEEADKLDTMFSTLYTSTLPANTENTAPVLYFSTWLLYHVLRLMIRYILSGFELELFSVHEYPYLYWYLYELLYPWLTTCLHKADSHLQEYEQYLENQSKSATAGGKKPKKNKSSNKNKKPRPYVKELTNCQAFATLCSGYFKLVIALKKENKTLVPDSSFDNEAVRYQHRFAPFNSLLTPPSMPYSQYMEVYQVTAHQEPATLYIGAARDFGRARQLFESVASIAPHMSDLETIVGITKKNMVASSVLSKDSSRKVEFEFETHKTFPVAKFV